MSKSLTYTLSNLSYRVGTYGTGSSQKCTLNFSGINYNPANRKIKKITMSYTFSGAGSASEGKRLYFYNGDTQLGYVSGLLHNNTVNFVFDTSNNTAIYNGLNSMFQSGNFSILHKEPTVRGWYGSGSTKYSYEYLGINAVTLTIEYDEEAYVYYGVNGEWKQCSVFYGVNGQWVQVLPHYGINGSWVQV